MFTLTGTYKQILLTVFGCERTRVSASAANINFFRRAFSRSNSFKRCS